MQRSNGSSRVLSGVTPRATYGLARLVLSKHEATKIPLLMPVKVLILKGFQVEWDCLKVLPSEIQTTF